MQKIGILGGSFDPVHLGHVELARAAVKELDLDSLFIMPAHIQPFKMDKKLTSDEHRIKMAELAFSEDEKIEVSKYEVTRDEISYTFDTLTYFREAFHYNEIVFIMGTDSMLSFEKWFKGEEMLRDFSLAVSKRPGYKDSELEETIARYREKYLAKISVIESIMPDISSTEIRNRLKANESIDDLVPEKVEEYILENGLYRD